MAITTVKEVGKGGLERYLLKHESGTVAEVYSFGATLTSVKTKNGQELLFVSGSSHFDGQKPIRGGVPLVFPKFGDGWEGEGNPSALPSHGFARRSKWVLKESGDNQVCMFLDQSMVPEEYATAWPFNFEIRYYISLFEDGFSHKFEVKNTGDKQFPFQALLHTYYNIKSVGDISVKGFKGKKFLDKLQSNGEFTEEGEENKITQEVDRIYKEVDTVIHLSGLDGAQTEATITLNHSSPNIDTVLWNPWVAKAARMDDFGDEEYKKMVCVEPGYVSGAFLLEPTKLFHLEATVKLA